MRASQVGDATCELVTPPCERHVAALVFRAAAEGPTPRVAGSAQPGEHNHRDRFEEAPMTWMMLAVFAAMVVVVSRRSSGWTFAPHSPRHRGSGVEGVRRLRSETKAALAAATTMLRS